MYAIKKFYNSDLFMAILVGLFIGLLFILSLVMSQRASALQFPLQGNTALKVESVNNNAYVEDGGNDFDIQPALGYKAL